MTTMKTTKQLRIELEAKRAEAKSKTYYLAIEKYDIERYSNKFEMLEVKATSVKDAVAGYLDVGDCEENSYIDDELTIEGKTKDKRIKNSGRYAGEEYCIGIGTTKEAAALQYFKSRVEQD